MSLDGATASLLYRHELRSLLRDWRAVFFSIVLPLLIAPIYFYANQHAAETREDTLAQTVYRYALSGESASHARGLLELGLASRSENEQPPPQIEEVAAEDPASALEEGRLHVHLVAEPRSADDEREDGGAEEIYRVDFRADRDASRAGADILRDLLGEGRRARRAELLVDAGFPIDPGGVLVTETTNAASEARTEGAALGRWLGAILVLFMVSGASIAAADVLAGEKERGTLETLLTTAAGRLEIVVAKLLLVLTVGLAIAACSVGGALLWISTGVGGVSSSAASAFTPLALAVILVMLAPVSALVAGLLLLVSGRARTYREAQFWYLPVTLGLFVPALAPLLPGVSLRSAVALVPISGVSVALRDALAGRYDAPFLALAWLSTAAAALWIIHRVANDLSPERLVVPGGEAETGLRGGRRLFERRVGLLFLGLWAAIVVLSLGAPWSDVRVTLFVNLVLLFGGTTLASIVIWKLDPRDALSLRAPRIGAIAGVVLGAPAAAVVISGLFRLLTFVLPVPPEALEISARALLPEDIPLWQILPMLTLLPALFEELAFRGILLHGLRRRMGPFALVAVNGLVFGFFHVSLYRIVPTAVLGGMCVLLVLATRSIYPAMIWHALYNGAAIALALAGVSPWDLGAGAYAGAAGLLLVATWIIWRTRPRDRDQAR